MLFPTLDFGLFFLFVFALAWALRPLPTGRTLFLVAASYFFYGYWDWRFCLLLAGSSLLNYGAGRLLDYLNAPRQRRLVLVLAVAANLGVLGFFKYYNFFIESLNDLLFNVGLERELPFLEIVLPVGISFFTFQGISYVVDVYSREIRAARSLLHVLLYISFFPQLVAGPIVRARTFLPQIETPPDPTRILAAVGWLLILGGLFKKVVIANYLATEMVDRVFLTPGLYGTVDLLLAAYGYAVQIYCDFSAYSDIAIGTAALLGYRFQRNFDQPYRAASLREFWRRWHISLSSWLRDYLYIPLGGSQGGGLKTCRNLFITMFLGGLWHGAGWTFVLWGTAHGLGLALERISGWGRSVRHAPPGLRLLGVLLVFHFVCAAWILFRADALPTALEYYTALAQFDLPVTYATPLILLLLTLGLSAQWLPPDLHDRLAGHFIRLPLLVQGLVVGVGVVAIDALGPAGVAPFIYFQF